MDPLILLALTLGFYWKIAFTNQYTWLDSPDVAYQTLPWIQFQASEWHQGRLPLWDPNHWGGQPLLAQIQPGTAYPINWILFSLPLRDGRFRLGYLDAYFLATHFLGAVFAYWLCRDLRRSRAASLLAGAFFSLGGFAGGVTWPGILNGIIWAPLILLFLLRAARGRKPWTSAALAGVFGGVAYLSGHHIAPTLLLVTSVGIWLWFLFRTGRPNWKVARLAALSLAITLLVGAVQILPAIEYGRRAIRWVGAPDAIGWGQKVPYSVHAEYSLPPSSLIGIFVPGAFKHANPFVGVTVVSLALLGLACGWRRRAVRVAGAIALGGLLFALGGSNVFHGILYSLVPMLEKAREPAMAIFIFHLGITVLAAWGFDSLRRGEPWLYRVTIFLIGIGVIGTICFIGITIFTKSKVTLDDRAVWASFLCLFLAAALYGIARRSLSRTAGALVLTALMLLELGSGSAPRLTEKTSATALVKLRDAPDVVWFLRGQPGAFRVEVDDQEIPYNFGDWQGFQDMGGYFPSLPTNVWKMGLLARRETIYGVRYSITKQPPKPTQQLAFTSAIGLKVYRNPEAYPRVWSEHRVGGCSPSQDQVRIVRYEPSQVVIATEMACPGTVVLSDNDFPGWRAEVDGRSAPIKPVLLSLRSVAVSEGRHTVEMRYRPLSVYLGAALTCLGLLATALLVWREQRAVVNYS